MTALLAGCGSETRDNEPRPPTPAGVSVNVQGPGLTISPERVAFGPEIRQQVIQNREVDEIRGDPDQPMPVEFTIANKLNREVRIEVAGPVRRILDPITATGTASSTVELPTGAYEVRVLGRGPSRPAELRVGPTRISPQNDLLLP